MKVVSMSFLLLASFVLSAQAQIRWVPGPSTPPPAPPGREITALWGHFNNSYPGGCYTSIRDNGNFDVSFWTEKPGTSGYQYNGFPIIATFDSGFGNLNPNAVLGWGVADVNRDGLDDIIMLYAYPNWDVAVIPFLNDSGVSFVSSNGWRSGPGGMNPAMISDFTCSDINPHRVGLRYHYPSGAVRDFFFDYNGLGFSLNSAWE